MADTKISALTSITGSSIDPAADLVAVVDTSATTTKKATVGELLKTTFNALFDISGSSGGQIKFPASQNASSNANTLDDYEEGTWTPAVGGTATYTTQNGAYTKIGNTVTIVCNLIINSIGSGSSTGISGLPFAVATYSASAAVAWTAAATAMVSVVALVTAGTTTITLYGPTAASVNVNNSAAILGNSTAVQFSSHYYV